MFHASRKKVERDKKHIQDLMSLLDDFLKPDLYSVSIEKVDARHGINYLVVDIHKSETEFLDEAALIIGDALHNPRSALDLLYYEIVQRCDGTATKWTRFPVRDTREELKGPLNSAVEQKQITCFVCDFILDTIKPYQAGNYTLWAVDDMDIRDKHQLLIPTFQMMGFFGIRLENDEHVIMDYPTLLTDESCRKRLDDSYGRNPTVKDKGHAATGIGFHLGVPYEGQGVIPALNRIAEEVTRTIEAFDLLLR